MLQWRVLKLFLYLFSRLHYKIVCLSKFPFSKLRMSLLAICKYLSNGFCLYLDKSSHLITIQTSDLQKLPHFDIYRISRWTCTSVNFGAMSVFHSMSVQGFTNWLLGQNIFKWYGFRTLSLSTKKPLISIRQLQKISFYEFYIPVKFWEALGNTVRVYFCGMGRCLFNQACLNTTHAPQSPIRGTNVQCCRLSWLLILHVVIVW